jgi:hypothetical protein
MRDFMGVAGVTLNELEHSCRQYFIRIISFPVTLLLLLDQTR